MGSWTCLHTYPLYASTRLTSKLLYREVPSQTTAHLYNGVYDHCRRPQPSLSLSLSLSLARHAHRNLWRHLRRQEDSGPVSCRPPWIQAPPSRATVVCTFDSRPRRLIQWLRSQFPRPAGTAHPFARRPPHDACRAHLRHGPGSPRLRDLPLAGPLGPHPRPQRGRARPPLTASLLPAHQRRRAPDAALAPLPVPAGSLAPPGPRPAGPRGLCHALGRPPLRPAYGPAAPHSARDRAAPQHVALAAAPLRDARQARPAEPRPPAALVGRLLHVAGDPRVAALQLHETPRRRRPRLGRREARPQHRLQRHPARPPQLRPGRLSPLQRRRRRLRRRPRHLPLHPRRGERPARGRPRAHPRRRRSLLRHVPLPHLQHQGVPGRHPGGRLRPGLQHGHRDGGRVPRGGRQAEAVCAAAKWTHPARKRRQIRSLLSVVSSPNSSKNPCPFRKTLWHTMTYTSLWHAQLEMY